MRYWRRQHSREAGRRETALFEFSRKLVGAAGVGEIAHALFRTIDDVFEIDQCVLLSVNDEQTRAVGIAAMGGMDAQVRSIVVDLAEDTSAVAQVVRDRAPHRVIDGQRETLQNRQVAEVLGIRSALYVPLQTSGGVIAVAVIATTGRMKAFRRDEVDLVQKLANDAAVAIERARFAQALREVGERELIVASVARAIRESLDPRQVLRTAARELGEQTDADSVHVAMLWSEQLESLACTWTPQAVDVHPFDEGQLPQSARLAIDGQQTVPARAHAEAPRDTGLALPLLQRENVLGVLTIDRAHRPFEEAEIRLIELIAIEIGAALEYVRLYQGGRKHLDEQLALARAAQSLTADLRFDRVLEHIVDEVVKLLRTSSAAFYTFDREDQVLTLSAAFGEAERRAVGDKMGLVGLAGRVVRAGVSQYTNDYARELGEEIHPVFEGVQRAISSPVRWQGDLRGVISVATRDSSRIFSQHDVNLLEAFADLASLALHNADAYSAHSRQARIQAGFYRISQVLSSSLSRAATLDALAQAATEALDGDWSLVVGGDGVEEDLHLEGSFVAPSELVEKLRHSHHFEDSPAALALQHRRVVTSRRLADDERVGDDWRQLLADVGVSSVLAVPVSAHGRHSAVVMVCFERPLRFGDEELVVANNLASAASAALERAGLFENERRTRRLSEMLADVSSLLAETLKAQTVIERIVEQSAVLLEVDACSLAIDDREGATEDDLAGRERIELRVHSAAGSDQALVSLLERSPVGGLVEEVARSRRSVSVEELASETSAQALQGTQYDSFLGVPLFHPRGHLIGVLAAYSRRHRAWSEAEITALESFASSASIAIRNAELYAGVKRERDTIEKLLASIAEGIVATDAAGRVTLWNQAAEHITGLPRDQVVGRSWRDVLGLAAETVVDDGTAVVEARPQGVPMWLSVTASRLREKERDTGAIYAFRDVSAHYTLDRLKSDFVSTVSYVLRTPLTSIYGFAQTLLRDDLEFGEDDRRTFLEYIATETERLTSIVDDLLQVATIDAGSVDVQVADCNVSAMIDEVTGQVRRRSPGHEINVATAGGKLVARADAEKLQTVLLNLLENAVQFSPDGGQVQVEAERENGAVQIRVSDSGLGIPPSEQKHLFTKFYVSPQASEIAGSGLGLYISKGLVTAMGGRIWVSSQLGAGSTFTVELPVAGG